MNVHDQLVVSIGQLLDLSTIKAVFISLSVCV